MKREITLRHEFVEYIPNNLDEGTIYISTIFATAVHKCCCGCGYEVVTPLSPTDWKLIFDGESISLYPSIGNWSFPCQSHYWIKRDRVKWARQWSKEEIIIGRSADLLAKQRAVGHTNSLVTSSDTQAKRSLEQHPMKKNLWRKLLEWLF